MNPGSQSAISGHITIYADQDRRRSELQLGTYRETRLRLGDTLYIARTQSYPIFGISRIIDLDRMWRIKLAAGAKLGNVSDKKVDNLTVECFHEKTQFKDDEFCFRAQNQLVRQRNNFGTDIIFSEYDSVEGIQFPTAITYREKQPIRTVVIQNVHVATLQITGATFAIPTGARQLGCDDPKGGEMLKRVDPKFPESERRDRRTSSAVMYVYGVLEKDGSFTNVHVASPSGPAFEDAVKQVIPQWKFAPATCGGKPVAIEREIWVEIEIR